MTCSFTKRFTKRRDTRPAELRRATLRPLSLLKGARAQATVEAAFLIPLIFLLLLLLLQPLIVLYDHMIMEGAASDGCRLLATSDDGSGASEERCREAILRHLGAIPDQALFHVHEGGCSWQIDLSGDESSKSVSVSLTTKLRPLPLLDVTASLMGITDGDGNLTVRVTESLASYDEWVTENEQGLNPSDWASKRK